MVLALSKARNFLIRTLLARRDLPSRARRNLRALDHLKGANDVRGLNYVIFDLETTGVSTKHDRVLSIGAVRLRRGLVELGDVFNEYINPGAETSNDTVTLHGIKPDMVASARSLDQVLNDFLLYLGKDVLVAHRAQFDLAFVHRFMKRRYGFGLQNLVIDTLGLARALFPPQPFGHDPELAEAPYSLDSLIRHYDIELGVRHTAVGDALTTALILQRLLQRMVEHGSGRLKDLIRMAGVPPP